MITHGRKAKLNSLKEYQERIKGKEKTKNRFDFWSSVIFISCICLAVWSINIYRDTFIDWKILVPPTIIGSFIATVLFWKRFLKAGNAVWVTFFVCFSCGGASAHFGFMILNQQFANTLTVTEIFAIEKIGRFASGGRGCGEPYVIINFHGIEKQVVFSCSEADIIKQFNKIELKYSKGLFGYKIIRSKKLEK